MARLPLDVEPLEYRTAPPNAISRISPGAVTEWLEGIGGRILRPPSLPVQGYLRKFSPDPSGLHVGPLGPAFPLL
jgi:hypothetical protein